MFRDYVIVLLAATVLSVGSSVRGYECSECGRAIPCAVRAPVQYVERTLCAPQWVTETRKVPVVEYRTEQRERTYTVYKRVPETKQVTREYTRMVPETRTRIQNYSVCKPVWRAVEKQCTVSVPVWKDVTRQCTVMVPHQEVRTTMRRVCKSVPVEKARTVCEDHGRWETRVCERVCRCGCCSCCTRVCTRRVWVPNIVRKQVPYTAYERQWIEVPHTYSVTVCKPETRTYLEKVCEYRSETRTRTVRLCEYRREERSRVVKYTICVPKKMIKTCTLTSYKCVPETRVEEYSVCVPYTVEKEVQVNVCRMVPKTVRVPVCCGGSSNRCHCGCR